MKRNKFFDKYNYHVVCGGCKYEFNSLRAINGHWQRNKECAIASNTDTTAHQVECSSTNDFFLLSNNDDPINNEDSSETASIFNKPINNSTELIQMKLNHDQSNSNTMPIIAENVLDVNVKLLNILKQA